jgi:glutaredoxin-like YruB-family protein
VPKKVTVYSTPTCPYCTRAKQFLTDNRVPFDTVDVSVDTAKAEEMIQKSGQMGVPVLDIDGEIIVGFDRERIQRALGLT